MMIITALRKLYLNTSQGWLEIVIALGAIGGGAIVALAFWLGRRSGTKKVILRVPSNTSRIDR